MCDICTALSSLVRQSSWDYYGTNGTVILLLCCVEVTCRRAQVAGQCRYTHIDGINTPSRRSIED